MTGSRFDEIRKAVEATHPGAFTTFFHSDQERAAIKLPGLPNGYEGIPYGGLTQAWAPRGCTAGRATLLTTLLVRVTAEEKYSALVDVHNCFDSVRAESYGVQLDRLLWVRSGAKATSVERLEHAFKATDILLHNGGFSLIAVDIADIHERLLRKVPLTTWVRFARVVERMATALLFLTSYPAAQNYAALTIGLSSTSAVWSGPNFPAHARLLEKPNFKYEVTGGRMRMPVKRVSPAVLTSSKRA